MPNDTTLYLYRAASGQSHIVDSYTASKTVCGRDVDATEIPDHALRGELCAECEEWAL